LKSTTDRKLKIIRWAAWGSFFFIAMHPYITRAYDLYIFFHAPKIANLVLVEEARQALAETNPGNPIVYTIFSNLGQKLVVKETKAVSIFSKISSRFKLAREYVILEAIQDLPYVTKLVGKVHQDAFCIEYIPHLPEKVLNDLSNREMFKKEFIETLETLHSRHIYHLDLKNIYNILIAEDFSCRLIDFGNARKLDRVMSFVMGPFLQYRDYIRALKGLFLINPELLTKQELKFLMLNREMKKMRFLKKPDGLSKRIQDHYLARE
jgi:serine/threonine protein kinase